MKIILILIFLLVSMNNRIYSEDLIVNPKQIYTYDVLKNDINLLAGKYPEILEVISLGKTTYGRDIYALKLGKGKANILIMGAFHAREWITTNLLMNKVEFYADAYANNIILDDKYNSNQILNEVSIYFIPMVNPDGVTLQQIGLSAFPEELHDTLIKMNEGSTDFKRWKANAEGFDLNRQFPAEWDHVPDALTYPYFKYYKGDYPLQAVEAKTIAEFTKEIDPEIAVSYHSSGRVLYWFFNNKVENIERDRNLAEMICDYTNYELVEPEINQSSGGFTDWFIQEFNRPGFTPEVSYPIYENEVPLSAYDAIWERNKYVGILLADEGYTLYKRRIKINYNGKNIYSDFDPVIIDGRTFVPIQLIIEHFGLTLNYNSDNEMVEIMKVTGKNIESTIEVKPIIRDNRILVPIRYIAESLGIDVDWDKESNSIILISGVPPVHENI